MLTAPISFNASGDQTVVAAVPGRKIRVLSIVLVTAGVVGLTWKDGTNALSGTMPLTTNSVLAIACATMSRYELPVGVLETSPGSSLVLNLNANIQTSGHVSYLLV